MNVLNINQMKLVAKSASLSFFMSIALMGMFLASFTGCTFDGSALEEFQCVSSEECDNKFPGRVCIAGYCQFCSEDAHCGLNAQCIDNRCEPVQVVIECGGTVCAEGQTCCDEQCVDVNLDPRNCGSCGVACEQNQICTDSQCGCVEGWGDCNETEGCETNLLSNEEHCGACGNTCPEMNGQCIGGFCSCAAGFTGCEENVPTLVCDVDLFNSQENCGGCGISCTELDDNLTCSNAACSCDGSFCGEGENCCQISGMIQCVDTMTVANCGGCGITCQVGESCDGGACACEFAPNGEACSDGEECCAVGGCVPEGTCLCGNDVCQPGEFCCGESCVPNDELNCGECGNSCQGGRVCLNNSCICPAGEDVCDGVCKDTVNDINNCGGCDVVCVSEGGSASCNNGSCEIVCDADRLDCDNDLSNGCEVEMMNDELNCGACDNICQAEEVCADGGCVPQCTLPYHGDGICNPGSQPNGNDEDWRSAPLDCDPPMDVNQACGDGSCNRPQESATNCIRDCQPQAGDGICEGPEVPAGTDLDMDGVEDNFATSDCTRTSACNPASDCDGPSFNRGNCPDYCPVEPSCGDGACNGSETINNCVIDCSQDGDGVCDGTETCASVDCPFACADGYDDVCL